MGKEDSIARESRSGEIERKRDERQLVIVETQGGIGSRESHTRGWERERE